MEAHCKARAIGYRHLLPGMPACHALSLCVQPLTGQGATKQPAGISAIAVIKPLLAPGCPNPTGPVLMHIIMWERIGKAWHMSCSLKLSLARLIRVNPNLL